MAKNNTIQVTWKVNKSLLELLDKSMPQIASDSVRETLENRKEYIRSRWSATSPSLPGNSPAVVTGELDKSLKVIRRDGGGRFATSFNATSWALRVEADYGAALEFGRPEINLAPRPFLRPAIHDAQKILGNILTAKLQVINRLGSTKYSVSQDADEGEG